MVTTTFANQTGGLGKRTSSLKLVAVLARPGPPGAPRRNRPAVRDDPAAQRPAPPVRRAKRRSAGKQQSPADDPMLAETAISRREQSDGPTHTSPAAIHEAVTRERERGLLLLPNLDIRRAWVGVTRSPGTQQFRHQCKVVGACPLPDTRSHAPASSVPALESEWIRQRLLNPRKHGRARSSNAIVSAPASA
jgi:hypothetical protein